ncbi:carboxypeptidase regulatory-like domain-containing protein, partial [Candidatus Calescamantes bacterium]|nr:carboxypeptidase regulatory-like domain-containing protein [Candidatus Calescamantes bacterium]
MDKYSSSEKYDPYMSVFLYPAAGDSDDWLYGELGTLAFTVEAGPSSLGFHPSWSVVEAYLPEQYEGFLSFAQEICSRHIYGCISDAETGLPISGATLKITELYNYSLVRNRYSNTAGNYYWGLTAGDYTLMVSKPGYQTVFHPFSIDQTPQEINIEMQPFESEEIAVKIVPNPAFGSNTVIALEVPQEGWLLNCSIYSIDGSIIYTFPPKTSTSNVVEDSFIVDKLRPDGTSLASGIYLVYIKAEKSGGLFKKVLKFAFID